MGNMADFPRWSLKWLLASCLVLCCVRLTLGKGLSGLVQSTPTFVWSPETYIGTGSEGQKSRVSYEVRLAEHTKE